MKNKSLEQFFCTLVQNYKEKAGIITAFVLVIAFLNLACTSKRESSISDEKRLISSNSSTDFTPSQNPSTSYLSSQLSSKPAVIYSDYVYVNNIKSVLFSRKGWDFSPPIIELNSADKLILQFDDLDADFKSYTYTVVHCDFNWQPTEMMSFEYIRGFAEDQISEYAFSINTRVPFTHYRLEFPNTQMQPTRSGNYILKVFLSADPSRVILSRRFMVFEQKVAVDARVSQATNLDYRHSHQEVNFTLNTSNYRISNPYRDLRVVVKQNGRWDNAITTLQPRLVQGNQLIYQYELENLFEGGNEFRHFDTKSLRFRSQRIDHIQGISQGWDVHLLPDRNRAFLRYVSDSDINGRFLIKTDDYQNAALESDYTRVNFYLPMALPLEGGSIYVAGGLTHWHYGPENKMVYNYGKNRYELTLLLKQGYYNYLYAFVADGSTRASLEELEGNHSVTENDYTILVYHRNPGDAHESLVGVRHINTAINR